MSACSWDVVRRDALNGMFANSSGTLVYAHSGDQLVLPLAEGPSEYCVAEVTRHLTANIAVIRHFLERDIVCEGEEGKPGVVRIA